MKLRSQDVTALLRAIDQLLNALGGDYTLRERNALRRVHLLTRRLFRYV